MGSLQLLAIQADLDYRLTTRNGETALEFTWHGSDEGEEICGRGWAIVENNRLRGEIFIHLGDESSFVAERVAAHPKGLARAQRAVSHAASVGAGSSRGRRRGDS